MLVWVNCADADWYLLSILSMDKDVIQTPPKNLNSALMTLVWKASVWHHLPNLCWQMWSTTGLNVQSEVHCGRCWCVFTLRASSSPCFIVTNVSRLIWQRLWRILLFPGVHFYHITLMIFWFYCIIISSEDKELWVWLENSSKLVPKNWGFKLLIFLFVQIQIQNSDTLPLCALHHLHFSPL